MSRQERGAAPPGCSKRSGRKAHEAGEQGVQVHAADGPFPPAPAISRAGDTIAAVATGAGGGIGIVRISGPDALSIAGRVLRCRGGRPLETSTPFLLVLCMATDPDSFEPIDEVLAVHMPEGRSYTGETTVEIQGHGGRSVLEALLQATLRAGARLAGPGEFTRRAFLGGRLDLTQAEAVSELIGAEDEEARKHALRQLHGAVAGAVNGLRERLLDLVARVEGALDFEAGEIPADLPSALEIGSLAADIRRLAEQAGERADDSKGIRIAIAGRPNSGKSSIFNYLLRSERSIVASLPGTTRDYIEERSLIGGATVTLIDTAGIRTTEDEVEAEGIRRSIRQIKEAGIVLLVIDGSTPRHPEDSRLIDLAADRSPMLLISKADLRLVLDREDLLSRVPGLAAFPLSTVTGEGFPAFVAALASRCRATCKAVTPEAAAPNLRHREALRRAAEHLESVTASAAAGDLLLDQLAAELLAGLVALGEITGQTVTEEILERIFNRFCVGK